MRDGTATRHKIHQAALALFVQNGVTETSVRELAQTAGVAEGTLYRHYASKDELVADLFSVNYAAFAQRLSRLIQGNGDFFSKLDAIIADIFRFYDEDPTLFRFLLLVQHQALPRIADDSNNPVSVLHELVEQAVAAGAIAHKDAALVVSMILGMVLQPATAIVYGRLPEPLSCYAPQISAALRRALA